MVPPYIHELMLQHLLERTLSKNFSINKDMFKTVQLWTTQLDPIELLCICLPLTQFKTVCNSHTWDSKSAVINLCFLIVYLIISLRGLATSHHHHSQYQFHNYTFLEKN